jgi:hypothetical protein
MGLAVQTDKKGQIGQQLIRITSAPRALKPEEFYNLHDAHN